MTNLTLNDESDNHGDCVVFQKWGENKISPIKICIYRKSYEGGSLSKSLGINLMPAEVEKLRCYLNEFLGDIREEPKSKNQATSSNYLRLLNNDGYLMIIAPPEEIVEYIKKHTMGPTSTENELIKCQDAIKDLAKARDFQHERIDAFEKCLAGKNTSLEDGISLAGLYNYINRIEKLYRADVEAFKKQLQDCANASDASIADTDGNLLNLSDELEFLHDKVNQLKKESTYDFSILHKRCNDIKAFNQLTETKLETFNEKLEEVKKLSILNSNDADDQLKVVRREIFKALPEKFNEDLDRFKHEVRQDINPMKQMLKDLHRGFSETFNKRG